MSYNKLKMRIIYNRHIPFKGFRAVNLFGIVFARRETGLLNKETLNHESIHTRQIVELLAIGFYAWYAVEWIIRLIQYRNCYEAYKNIGVEREAYSNQNNLDYLKRRPLFSFAKYLKKHDH